MAYTTDTLTLRELLDRLLRHWILMVSVAGVVILGVAGFTWLVAARYESTAVVRIMRDNPTQAVGQALSEIPGAGVLGLGRDDLDTEVGVLRSGRIAEAVVDSLSLMVVLKDPAGVRERYLTVLAQGEGSREGELVFDHQGQGSFQLRFEEEDGDDVTLGDVRAGEEVTVAGYRIRLATAAPDGEEGWPETLRVQLLTRYDAVEALQEDLEIRQQEAGSRLVEIQYTMTDRLLAASVVNAVVDEYRAYKSLAEAGDARFTVSELREEVGIESEELALAEERLRAYQEEARIVAPEEEAIQQVQRLAELQVAADKVEVERSALQDLLGVIEEKATAPGEARRDTDTYRQLATFPSLISNGAIQELLMTLTELENQRTILLGRRTTDNTDVVQLTTRIQELEDELHRVGSDYLESLDLQLRSTSQAIDRLNELLESLPDRELRYGRLYRDVQVHNESYLLLQNQLRLAEVREAIRAEGVRIIDRGRVAPEDEPAFPRPWVNVFLGILLAGALGLAAGLLRDLWDA